MTPLGIALCFALAADPVLEPMNPLPLPKCGEKGACQCPWRGFQALSTWAEIPAPTDASTLQCANYSDCSWNVRLGSGEPRAFHSRGDLRSDPVPFKAPGMIRYTMKVENGWLVGANNGEWGASVRWYSSDGGTSQELSRAPVNALVRIGETPFAGGDLEKIYLGKGQVLRFSMASDGGWSAQQLAAFEHPVWALLPENPERLLAITNSGAARVSLDGGVQVIHETKGWQNLYPQSVAEQPDGTILIGMRFAVAKLTPSDGGYRETWLVPPACAKPRLKGLECVCGGK